MFKLQAKGVAIWADEHHWTVHCVRSSEWSTFNLHLCISYQCIWGWQHLQKPSPKCHFTYIFCHFYFALGLPHDSADCWSAHRSSAARDSFKRVHDWCKAGWRRPGDANIIMSTVNNPKTGDVCLFVRRICCRYYKLRLLSMPEAGYWNIERFIRYIRYHDE